MDTEQVLTKVLTVLTVITAIIIFVRTNIESFVSHKIYI